MGKATFVLNNIFAKDLLKSSDVEAFLGTKLAVELPYDPLIYGKAVNEGIPVSTGAPKSAAAERLSKLAGIAFGGEANAGEATQAERKGRLSGLLRRA
jgi:Flp pilus assembly CpaE family ATPase